MSKWCLVVLGLIVAAPAVGIAESDSPVATIRVRTISATPHEQNKEGVMDKRLNDIKGKLETLPYGTFSLKSSQQVEVPVKKKRVVKLPNGQQLTLRLLYRNERKLGIWIDWLDDAGMQLLNSKIHLKCTEPVLAGTDNTDGSAMLLAIALEDAR